MKKILFMTLALALMLSAASCSSPDRSSGQSDPVEAPGRSEPQVPDASQSDPAGSQEPAEPAPHASGGQTISAGVDYTLGILPDGTAVDTGGALPPGVPIRNVVAAAAGWGHAALLHSSGKITVLGDLNIDPADVAGWQVIAIDMGYAHIVGLRDDGTAVAAGVDSSGCCQVGSWTDIIAITAGNHQTAGLRSDGTVVMVGSNGDGQCEVGDWAGITAVSVGNAHTVGLRSDGTVAAVGNNEYGQCDVEDWTDIVAVAAGGAHTLGLRSDGTVVVAGTGEYGQCGVEDWTDIVAIAAGFQHSVGLRSDGTVVAVGNNEKGACNVDGWVLRAPEV